MKIKEITSDHILFTDDTEITYTHEQECCEYNYADFQYLEDESGIYSQEFYTPLTFEEVDNKGFRFGNPPYMYFVPCYSVQNGWYSRDINIYYNHELVLPYIFGKLECD